MTSDEVTTHELLLLPTAPVCTAWCPGHLEADQTNPRCGWDEVTASAITKACRLVLNAVEEHGNWSCNVELQRWAHAEIHADATVDVVVSLEEIILGGAFESITDDEAERLAQALASALAEKART